MKYRRFIPIIFIIFIVIVASIQILYIKNKDNKTLQKTNAFISKKKYKVYTPLIKKSLPGIIIGKIYSTVSTKYCEYQPVWSPQVFEYDGKYYWIIDSIETGGDLTDKEGYFSIRVNSAVSVKGLLEDTYVLATGMPETWGDPNDYLIVFPTLLYVEDGTTLDIGVLSIDENCYPLFMGIFFRK